jgi:TrmH family RNA methyltransferase
MKTISSKDNPEIKYLVKLFSDKKMRDNEGLFIVEGFNQVREAKLSGCLERVYAIKETNEFENLIVVSPDIMKKVTDAVTPQGIIGVVRKVEKSELSPRILYLDHVQDPGNLGTLIRSARAFGFNTLILDGCVDPYNPKTLRSAEGNIFFISIVNESLDSLKKKGYEIYSTSMNGISLESENSFPQKLVLILGNEGRGVREEIQEIADKNLTISMIGAESLNVAVAGSIIMHHIMAKQKAE